jgi:hypothetical protein
VIKRKFLLTIAAILLFNATPAFALKVIETDQFFIYFPEEAVGRPHLPMVRPYGQFPE